MTAEGQSAKIVEANKKKVPTKGPINEYKDLEKNAAQRADDSAKPFSEKLADMLKTATKALRGEGDQTKVPPK